MQPDLAHADRLSNDGRTEEAIAVMRKLLIRLPSEPEVHLWLGPAAVVAGAFDDAIEHARLAVELAEDDPNTLFRAANFARWGDRDAAREYVERAKDLVARWDDPSRFVFLADLPHLEGMLAFDEDHPEAGLRYLERAYAEQPHIVAGDLAEAYLAEGHPQEALNVIDQALQRDDSDWQRKRLLEQRREARAQIGT